MSEGKRPGDSTNQSPIENPQSSMKNGLSSDERNWGMLCHLSAFAGYIIPFGNIIGPLIIWLVKSEEFPSVDAHGKEAINFQISMAIYCILAAVLIMLLIGFILLPLLMILNLLFIVVAALKARDGIVYRYPLSIRFL
jgi:uncharacterized protein